MTHEDATAAVVLASQAQFSGLVDLLIEKGLLADGESRRIIEKAIAFLGTPTVVQSSPPEALTAARKILSDARGAM